MTIWRKRGIRLLAVWAAVVLLVVWTNPQRAEASQIFTWGSSGEVVRTIQDKLKRWGYYTGSVDGKYGMLTVEAVKYFQRTNGLQVDGITGKQTLTALGIFLPAASPAPSATAPPGTSGAGAAGAGTSSNRESDVWLLACVINGEGRGEAYIGQVAIGAVVMNRVKHASFPNTISGVIYQPGAFDAVSDGQILLTPTQSCINAARDALNGWDPVDGAIFYWNPRTATNKWVQTLTVTKTVGNHVFAKN